MNPATPPPPQTMAAVLADTWREQGGLLKHPLVKNALLLYVVQFSSYLFPLATLPFLSRVLHPEKFGLVVFSQAFVWYFLTLSDYGFALTATRKVAAHRDESEELSRIFSSVMGAKLLLMGVGFALMLGIVFSAPKLRPYALLFTITYLNVVGNVIFGLAQAHIIVRLKWSSPSWAAIWSELIEGWPVFLSMLLVTPLVTVLYPHLSHKATAITGLVVDIYGAAAAYLFFRRTAETA
jgi:hypothetical protein